MRTAKLLTGLALALACAAAWAGQAAEAVSPGGGSPPMTLARAVCRPQFMVDGRSHVAGTAFLVQGPGARPLLMTAHHVLGMAGEPGGAVAWADAPARVRSAQCRTLDKTRVWTTGPALAVEGAHTLGELSLLNDVALLPIVGEGAEGAAPLRLADADPAPGDAVWLLAELDDPGRASDYLHRGHVIDAWGHLAFVYDEKHPKLRETSGAPILNAQGEVVGVNVGYNVPPGADAVVGVADDLHTLRIALAAAAAP